MFNAGLFPFLGGLFLGGLGGAAAENNHMQHQNQNYMAYPPTYVYYPPIAYQNVPMSPYYVPYNYAMANANVENHQYTTLSINDEQRGEVDLNAISHVPVYIYK